MASPNMKNLKELLEKAGFKRANPEERKYLKKIITIDQQKVAIGIIKNDNQRPKTSASN